MGLAAYMEGLHRTRKRRREIEAVMDLLAPYVKDKRDKNILEFGSGKGYQVPYLKRLGHLVASDPYTASSIKWRDRTARVVCCDATRLPFADSSFDMVFSSHVIEHIEDTDTLFRELKRVGDKDCLYVFTVPTEIWLLLSLPAQVYNGVRKILTRFTGGRGAARKETKTGAGSKRSFPAGHGWRPGFLESFRSFRPASWKALFASNGFDIMAMRPLLLYAPSEFPVVPTVSLPASLGVSSSLAFVLKDRASGKLAD